MSAAVILDQVGKACRVARGFSLLLARQWRRDVVKEPEGDGRWPSWPRCLAPCHSDQGELEDSKELVFVVTESVTPLERSSKAPQFFRRIICPCQFDHGLCTSTPWESF